jgi:hypothetical protein
MVANHPRRVDLGLWGPYRFRLGALCVLHFILRESSYQSAWTGYSSVTSAVGSGRTAAVAVSGGRRSSGAVDLLACG